MACSILFSIYYNVTADQLAIVCIKQQFRLLLSVSDIWQSTTVLTVLHAVQ